jgi:signal transduction protein with GAF and PtsI domain
MNASDIQEGGEGDDAGQSWTVWVCTKCGWQNFEDIPHHCENWEVVDQAEEIPLCPASEAERYREQRDAARAELERFKEGVRREMVVPYNAGLTAEREQARAERDAANERASRLEKALEEATAALMNARNGLDFGLAGWRKVEGNTHGPDDATPECARQAAYLRRARQAHAQARSALSPDTSEPAPAKGWKAAWEETRSERDRLEKALEEARGELGKLIERVEDDRRESDKILCHVTTARRYLNRDASPDTDQETQDG